MRLFYLPVDFVHNNVSVWHDLPSHILTTLEINAINDYLVQLMLTEVTENILYIYAITMTTQDKHKYQVNC